MGPFLSLRTSRKETLKMKLRKLDEKGQGLTEYLILLLLISIVSIAAVQTLGSTIKGKLQMAKRHIESDVTLESKE